MRVFLIEEGLGGARSLISLSLDFSTGPKEAGTNQGHRVALSIVSYGA